MRRGNFLFESGVRRVRENVIEGHGMKLSRSRGKDDGERREDAKPVFKAKASAQGTRRGWMAGRRGEERGRKEAKDCVGMSQAAVQTAASCQRFGGVRSCTFARRAHAVCARKGRRARAVRRVAQSICAVSVRWMLRARGAARGDALTRLLLY